MVRNTQLESMAVAQTAAGRMVVAGVKPAEADKESCQCSKGLWGGRFEY